MINQDWTSELKGWRRAPFCRCPGFFADHVDVQRSVLVSYSRKVAGLNFLYGVYMFCPISLNCGGLC